MSRTGATQDCGANHSIKSKQEIPKQHNEASEPQAVSDAKSESRALSHPHPWLWKDESQLCVSSSMGNFTTLRIAGHGRLHHPDLLPYENLHCACLLLSWNLHKRSKQHTPITVALPKSPLGQ